MKTIARRLLIVSVYSFALSVVAVAVTVRLEHARVLQVSTGSMGDTAPVGVHRVNSVSTDNGHVVIRTNGDANAAPDPWRLDARTADVAHAVVVLPPSVGIAGHLLTGSVAIRLLVGLLLVRHAAAKV